MTMVYLSLESPEFMEGVRTVQGGNSDLDDLFEQEQIRKCPPAPLDQGTVARFEQVIGRFNQMEEEAHTLTWYIMASQRTDSREALAQARYSELKQHLVRLLQLSTCFTTWIGSLDVEALIAPLQWQPHMRLPYARGRYAHLTLLVPSKEEKVQRSFAKEKDCSLSNTPGFSPSGGAAYPSLAGT
jgi:hypothetical protein